jgi:hypothetical protein
MKKKQIGKQCYIASLIGRFIFASDQLTTAWLFLKAVIYANCEKVKKWLCSHVVDSIDTS